MRRRAFVAGLLGLGAAASAHPTPRSYLDRFAPLSGSAWASADRRVPERVESDHGAATVRRDDLGVPHVEAEAEAAAYHAAGYLQAVDRLFQMDLLRRRMRGRIAEVAGPAALDSDRFHRQMQFTEAAEANWAYLADQETGALARAFAEGVNGAMADLPRPLGFRLLQYEPDPWTPVDTMLMEKQIAWGLTGTLRALRREVAADRLGADAVASLYPARLDHDVPILGGDGDGAAATSAPARRADHRVGADLVEWLSAFEPGPGVGSNSWIVGGEHTESGQPVLANDPHLTLTAPPVWYEQHLSWPGADVRGVTFPGVPFVIIGRNEHCAWGFTNSGADVIDYYRYDVDGERYRYDGEWREFGGQAETIPTADGPDATVTVRRTVPGPYLEREGQQVGVQWTGHAATATTRAVREYARADSLDAFREATRDFELPPQNLVYADRDGRTMYWVTGRIPARTVDGEPVRGDRVFDGSAGEGEWAGFEPFARPSWDGFRGFEEKPHVVDPALLSTANQRIDEDPTLAEAYASPYRARRIEALLGERVAGDQPVTPRFVERVQRDVRDGRVDQLRDDLVAAARSAAADGGPEGAGDDADGTATGVAPAALEAAADALEDWDGRMDRDSRGALLFVHWFDAYRAELLDPHFEPADLDADYYPRDWVVATIGADSRWVGDRDRAAVMARALAGTLDRVESEGWETYGDYATTGRIEHLTELGFLGYPAHPTDGSDQTVRNFDPAAATGSSWRMVVPFGEGEPARAVLPGGTVGDPFSEHYADQLRRWADGEYREFGLAATGAPLVEFGGDRA